MRHPFFEHPDGIPAEEDDRDFSSISITRDGKFYPSSFAPHEITKIEDFARWGGGKYQLVARGANGAITARSPIYEIDGPPKPFFPSSTASDIAIAAPSSGGPGVMQILAVATPLAGVLLTHLQNVREAADRKEAREREEKRTEREAAERRDELRLAREEQRHRETLAMQQTHAAQVAEQQRQFAEKVASLSTVGGGGGGDGDMKKFFDGVEFAKGMLEGQGVGQMMQMVPAVLGALKSAPRPAHAPMGGGFVGAPPSPFGPSGGGYGPPS